MTSKIDRIIAYYEEEKNNLISCIADCIKEEEYKTAHQYAKGLRLVNKKLRNISNLKDIFYDKKEDYRRFIKNMEKLIESGKSEEVKYWIEYLREQEEELKSLEKLQAQPRNKSKSTILHSTMLKLLSKEITGFSFVLGNLEPFVISARLTRKTLIISIPRIQHYLNTYLLRKKQIRQFIGLGFKLYNNGDNLMLFLDYSSEKNINSVEDIFMKIFFEILYFKEYTNESYIKYIENNSGE